MLPTNLKPLLVPKTTSDTLTAEAKEAFELMLHHTGHGPTGHGPARNYLQGRYSALEDDVAHGHMTLDDARENVLALAEVAPLIQDGSFWSGSAEQLWRPEVHGFHPLFKWMVKPVGLNNYQRDAREHEPEDIGFKTFMHFFYPPKEQAPYQLMQKMTHWVYTQRARDDGQLAREGMRDLSLIRFNGPRTAFFKEMLNRENGEVLLFTCDGPNFTFSASVHHGFHGMKTGVKWQYTGERNLGVLRIENLLRAMRRMACMDGQPTRDRHPDENVRVTTKMLEQSAA